MNQTLRFKEREFFCELAGNLYITQQQDIDRLMVAWKKAIDDIPEEYDRRYETYIMKRALMYIYIRGKIEKMPILQQRPEWLKLIDDEIPEEYRAWETKNMNEVLIPKERDFFVNNAMEPYIETQVHEWLAILPEEYRAWETKNMQECVLMGDARTSLYK